MENRIFRIKQEEYWDIWCEDVIVFPKEKPLNEVFTEENIRKLLTSYENVEEYPKIVIDIYSNYVEVSIYDKNDNSDYFQFVEMNKVLIVE